MYSGDPESRITRRRLLKRGATTTGLLMAGPPLFLAACGEEGEPGRTLSTVQTAAIDGPGYGPLVESGAELELPDGFRYVTISREGEKMSDGLRTPGYPDGTAAFEGKGGSLVLLRNHELFDPGKAIGPKRAYDPKAQGGVTKLIFDPTAERVKESYLVLNGTDNNCNGGLTPQGSWLSCEESTVGKKAGFDREHGYVFEVPASAKGPVEPVPLKAMGRFVHEASVVDPATGIVYMTEDEGPEDGFYRFVPKTPGRYDRGRLEMLAVRGEANYDTRKGQRVGESLPVEWVPITEVDPPGAENEPHEVLFQGLLAGGAVFVALEGAWWDESSGSVVMAASEGGDKELGQIWRFEPKGDAGKLTLVAESPGEGKMEEPDNVTVGPRAGGGILVCEDGTEGTDNFLRGVTPEGEIFPFARNTIEVDAHRLDAEDFPKRGEKSGFSEFAGACFSPDGRWLFVSVQVPGRTYAITGPWERGVL